MTMEKLLHERLREWIDSDYAMQLKDVVNAAQNGKGYIYRAIADEIERCYIPRPRFDDGEPAKFGEELENGKRIANIAYHIGGRCTINDTATWQGTCESDYELKNNETLKRPTLKVLDADGVEIKRGDEVWDIKGIYDNPLTVLELNESGTVKVAIPDGKGWTCFAPECLTHKQPVFDAEGVRICKGDTVYEVKTGHESTVTSTTMISSDGCTICCKDGCIGKLHYKPEDLTHREPDSLAKLRDDMKDVWENWTPKEMDGEWVDRLTALIERGA